MVKREELIREIRKAARSKGLDFALLRQGGGHEIWSLDGLRVPIPRHKEIGPKMAFEIRSSCEPKLGKDWWR